MSRTARGDPSSREVLIAISNGPASFQTGVALRRGPELTHTASAARLSRHPVPLCPGGSAPSASRPSRSGGALVELVEQGASATSSSGPFTSCAPLYALTPRLCPMADVGDVPSSPCSSGSWGKRDLKGAITRVALTRRLCSTRGGGRRACRDGGSRRQPLLRERRDGLAGRRRARGAGARRCSAQRRRGVPVRGGGG